MDGVQLIFAMFFALCLVWAAISDATTMRIANWIPAVLVLSFFAYAIATPKPLSIEKHLLIGAISLAVTFLLFTLGVFGGADGKLISVVALWAGPDHVAAFLVVMVIVGGMFGVLLMLVKILDRLSPEGFALRNTSLARWARQGVMPYGIPIALAALANLASIFEL
jgi:prepilin peptidase CpaA